MNWDVTMGGVVECAPGYTYLLLAERVHSCLLQVDAVIDRLLVVDTLEWQSPAAEALRQCLAQQMRQLYLLRADFGSAQSLMRQRADTVAAETAAAEAAAAGLPGGRWIP